MFGFYAFTSNAKQGLVEGQIHLSIIVNLWRQSSALGSSPRGLPVRLPSTTVDGCLVGIIKTEIKPDDVSANTPTKLKLHK